MIAAVETADGVFEVELETEEIVGFDAGATLSPADVPAVALPRLVAAAVAGSTVVALLDRRPPLAVSHDAGSTWREAGAGLPRGGRAIAVAETNPDVVVYGAPTRLYVSTDGGRFWRSLAVELPEIEAVELREA
jgi:photosystem II stability/assembly factor-like uncharacterized protein